MSDEYEVKLVKGERVIRASLPTPPISSIGPPITYIHLSLSRTLTWLPRDWQYLATVGAREIDLHNFFRDFKRAAYSIRAGDCSEKAKPSYWTASSWQAFFRIVDSVWADVKKQPKYRGTPELVWDSCKDVGVSKRDAIFYPLTWKKDMRRT